MISCSPRNRLNSSMNVHCAAFCANAHPNMEDCSPNLQENQHLEDYIANHNMLASCSNLAEFVALAAQSKLIDYNNDIHYAHSLNAGWLEDEQLMIINAGYNNPSPSLEHSSGFVLDHQLFNHDQGSFSWSLDQTSSVDQHLQAGQAANSRANSVVITGGDVFYDQTKRSPLPSQLEFTQKHSDLQNFDQNSADENRCGAYNQVLNHFPTAEISSNNCVPSLQEGANIYINTINEVEAMVGSSIAAKQSIFNNAETKRVQGGIMNMQTTPPNPAVSARSCVVNESVEQEAKRVSKGDQDEVKQVIKSGRDIIEPAPARRKRAREASCRMADQRIGESDLPVDVIHVRARRGQATDSHSLAERVRRERISQRMKLLQDLVPSCSKVLGKAAMLEEIINYVKSLQQQVEFLSMRLAASSSPTIVPQLDSEQKRIRFFGPDVKNGNRLSPFLS